MLKLNQIPEDRARQSLESINNTLARLHCDSPDFHDSIGDLSLKSGLLLYLLEGDADKIRSRFTAAARHLSLDLASRLPPAANARRNPHAAELSINVIACFGSDEDRRRIATLEVWQYRAPDHAETEALSRYLQWLCRYLGGSPLDLGGLAEVVSACGRTTATKEDKRFLAPSANGLMALESDQEEAWNLAMAQLLAAHMREARTGQFKLLPQGLICFPALMLAKLGLKRRLKTAVASAYLPLTLLED